MYIFGYLIHVMNLCVQLTANYVTELLSAVSSANEAPFRPRTLEM